MPWVRVLPSADVPVGGAVPVDVDGPTGERQELVAWRDVEGRPCVMAGRCPHQWSHLGTDGFVDGDELVCEAHFWRFDRAGRGTKLTVRGRRDPKGDVAVHPCRDLDGWLEIDLPAASVPPDTSGG